MSRKCNSSGFSIIELLVATAVMALLLVVLVSMTGQVQSIFRSTSGKAEQFREARRAFEAVSTQLAQATLNNYWDYDDANAPRRYLRRSELRFEAGRAANLVGRPAKGYPGHAVFFQAPIGLTGNRTLYGGLENLLNSWGYFVEFGNDTGLRPPFLTSTSVPPRNRFRLMEMGEQTESLTLPGPTGNSKMWFRKGVSISDPATRPVRTLAENVILLVVWPRLSPRDDADGNALTGNFTYSTAPQSPPVAPQPVTENQLPPVVQLCMVAIDENSARRLAEQNGTNAPPLVDALWFQTSTEEAFKADLKSLEDSLNQKRVAYRTFNAAIPIRGAKWSKK
jgi:uncharacterized protein (TIGR02599 family)